MSKQNLKRKLTYNAKDDFIFDQQTPEKKKKPQTKVRSRHSTAEKSEDEWSKVSEGFEGLDPLAWEQTKSRKKQKSRHSLTRVTSIGNTESPVKSQPSIHWDSSDGEENMTETTTHTASHRESHHSTHIQPHNVKSPSRKTASDIVKKYLKHSAHKLPRGSKTSKHSCDRNKAAAGRTSRDNTVAAAAGSSSFQQYWQSLLQGGDSQEREKPLISSVGSISQYDSDNEDQLLHTGCNGQDCEICQLIKSQRQRTDSANISPTSSPLITNPLKASTSAGKITASTFASKVQQTLGGSPERASEGDTGDGEEGEGLLVDSAKKKKKNKFIKEGLAERLTRLRAREKSAFTFWTHKLNQNKITDLSKVLTVHVQETTVNHSVLECRCISVSDQTKDKNLTVLFTGQLVDKIQEGAIVRIYPPWQKLTLGGDREVILCTQLSQVVGKKSPDKVTKQQQQAGTRWIKFGSWKCPCSEEGSVVPVTDCPADSVQDLHQQTAISTQSQELFPDSVDSSTPHDLETVRISQSNISPLAKLPDILTSIENRGHLVQTVQFLAKVRRVFCRKVLHVGNRLKSVGSCTQKLQHGFLAQDRKGVICEVLLPGGWERQQEWVGLMEEGEGRVYTFTGLKVVHRTNRAKHSALFSMLDSLWSPTQYSQDTEDSFNETDAKQTPIFCYILKAVLGESHCGLNNTEIPTPDRQMVGGSSEIPTLDGRMVKGSSLNVEPGRVSFEGKVVYSWHKTMNDVDTTVTYVCVQSGQVCPIHHTATFHCPLPLSQGRVVRVVDALVQKEGKMVLDGYSAVQEVPPPPHVSTTHMNIPDCSTDVKMYDLVKIQGSVCGVDEESAYMWSCCDRCQSDKLVGGASDNAVLTCTQCKMAVTEPLTKMKLQVFVSMGDITAKIQLQQNTIEGLLPEEDAPDEGYEVSSVLGKSVGPLHAVVTSTGSSENHSLLLEEVCLNV